jgi:type II secretory pathway component PulJ
MMKRDHREGFSLAEVLIVISIAVSIVFVVGNLNSNVTLLNNLVSQQLQSRSDIVQTLQIMTTEIRSAQPSQNGAYAIETVATSSFVFYSDVNKNGTIERVRYFLSSSTVYRGLVQPTGTPATYPTSTEVITDIIDNVAPISSSTPIFQYFDATYTGTQASLSYPITVSIVREILISFGADVKPKVAPGPTSFSALIDIRNLRSN